MSHTAMNWALSQKGLKPAAKIVLIHLADRHNPDFGCFPSQELLASDCEMGRSTLNRHLAALEELGLIRRKKRLDKTTKQQKSTRYILGFEGEFSQDTGPRVPNRDMEAVSQKQPIPCPNNDESRVPNRDTNLVREPLREPVIRATRASLEKILVQSLSKDVALNFIEHRRAIKKPLTNQAAKLVISALNGCASPDQIVNRSIMNGWQGVFPDKKDKSEEVQAKIDRWNRMGRGGE